MSRTHYLVSGMRYRIILMGEAQHLENGEVRYRTIAENEIGRIAPLDVQGIQRPSSMRQQQPPASPGSPPASPPSPPAKLSPLRRRRVKLSPLRRRVHPYRYFPRTLPRDATNIVRASHPPSATHPSNGEDVNVEATKIPEGYPTGLDLAFLKATQLALLRATTFLEKMPLLQQRNVLFVLFECLMFFIPFHCLIIV